MQEELQNVGKATLPVLIDLVVRSHHQVVEVNLQVGIEFEGAGARKVGGGGTI